MDEKMAENFYLTDIKARGISRDLVHGLLYRIRSPGGLMKNGVYEYATVRSKSGVEHANINSIFCLPDSGSSRCISPCGP